jgi:hypothetical protein
MISSIDFFLLLLSVVSITTSVSYLKVGYNRKELAAPGYVLIFLTCIHFLIPGLLIGLGYYQLENIINEKYIHTALFYLLILVIAIIAGAYLSKIFNGFDNRFTKRQWKDRNLVIVIIILLVAAWTARYHVIDSSSYLQMERSNKSISGPWYAFIRMFEVFPLHVITILSIRYWRDNAYKNRFFQVALFTIILLDIVYWGVAGRKENILLTFLIPIFTMYVLQKRIPKKPAILFILFTLIVFPLISIYRSLLTLGVDVSENIGEIFFVLSSPELIFQNENIGVNVLNRISLLGSLSASIRLIQDNIWDLFLGTSYFSVLIGIIPRFLWPTKPEFHYGGEFGRDAGFIASTDYLTSISVTYFGESYLNFSFFGVIVLLLMSFSFSWLYKKHKTSKHSETWMLCYLIALPSILYIGGTFSLYIGSLLKIIPFYYVLGRIMEGKKIE